MSTTQLSDVPGFNDLMTAMDALPAKLQNNVVRGAMRAGAKVQMASAQAGCPEDPGSKNPGALKASMRITTGLSARLGAWAKVHVGGKKAAPGCPNPWWVEFGTAAHLIMAAAGKAMAFGSTVASVIHHPGAQRKPFMRPALDGSAHDALNAAAAYMRGRMTKAGIELPDPGDASS